MSRFQFAPDHVRSADAVRAAAVANAAWRRSQMPAPRPVVLPALAPKPAVRPVPLVGQASEKVIGFRTRRILEACAAHFWVSVDGIIGRDRHAQFVNARHVAAWLLRREGFSLPQIAEKLKRADHTTVLSSLRRAEAMPELMAAAEKIAAQLAEEGAVHVG